MSESFYCQPKDLLHYVVVTLEKLARARRLGQDEYNALQALVASKQAIIDKINRDEEPKGDSLHTLSLEQLFALCVRCYSHNMSVKQALKAVLDDA